jgi:hypothetical protein
MIHEKNLKQKISWHCPFNPPYNGSAQSDALRPMSQRWVHEALFILSWSKMMLFVHCVYALRQAEWAGDVE